MPNPQQPELRRSGRGATSDDSSKINPDNHDVGGRSSGLPERTVPAENQPGHHPEVEQDHPTADRLPDPHQTDKQ